MGSMLAENASLREENDSKSSVLDAYYQDVFESRTNTRAPIDLNLVPPSEASIEGSLAILNLMFAKPLEYSNECKVIDLFEKRPQTNFLRR
jgi:hypothetical protein